MQLLFLVSLEAKALQSDFTFLPADSSISIYLSSALPETGRHPSCGFSGGFSDCKDLWALGGLGMAGSSRSHHPHSRNCTPVLCITLPFGAGSAVQEGGDDLIVQVCRGYLF
jgi:hypothetical protein